MGACVSHISAAPTCTTPRPIKSHSTGFVRSTYSCARLSGVGVATCDQMCDRGRGRVPLRSHAMRRAVYNSGSETASVAIGGVRSSAIGAAVAEFSRWLCSALFSARYHPPTHTHITCSCGWPGAGARLFWRLLRGVECRLAEQSVASVRRHRDRARHSGQALQCEGADGVASKLGQIRKLDSSRPPQEHRARYRSQCTIT